MDEKRYSRSTAMKKYAICQDKPIWVKKIRSKIKREGYRFIPLRQETIAAQNINPNSTNDCVRLHQIVALVDIPKFGVRKGTYGGFIESSDNLSDDGPAWVNNRAFVWGSSVVKGNALVGNGKNTIFVENNCTISDFAIVSGSLILSDHVRISEHVKIHAHWMDGEMLPTIRNHCNISGSSTIRGLFCIYENCNIGGNPYIQSMNNLSLYKNSKISGYTLFDGKIACEGSTISNNMAFIIRDNKEDDDTGLLISKCNAAASLTVDLMDDSIYEKGILIHYSKKYWALNQSKFTTC